MLFAYCPICPKTSKILVFFALRHFGGKKHQYGTFIEHGNAEYKDEKDLLKKFLIPLFKDFNTFIQTCNIALSRK